MSIYPDFSEEGYQVKLELARNPERGRITYLATAFNRDQPVVIKEFRFAIADSISSGVKTYQSQIQFLQENQPPRLISCADFFENAQGFCLVRDYKKAPSLAEIHSLPPERIKPIILSVLEIMADMQKRVPPFIHGNIKPENVLVDYDLNAYLVDWGLDRIGSGKATGIPGFMPPELQFNPSLSLASDLYSFGATIICLLTGTSSADIGKLVDSSYRLNFKGLLPQLSPRFISWLEKMVSANVSERYPNAISALKALKPIQVKLAERGTTLKALAAALSTVAIGAVATAGTHFIPDRHNSAAKQLIETRNCPNCDLENINLAGANLESVNLAGANLAGANLAGANLAGAVLGDAYFKGANLEGANLRGANLEAAYLMDANLAGANLAGALLGDAYFKGANLESANFRGANLQNANLAGAALGDNSFKEANLEGANLKGASLEGTNLQGANLGYVNLEAANLQGAVLLSANLEAANLKNANLESANLPDANLGGANLESANLGGANLKGALVARTNLKDANLKDANLNNTHLERKIISERSDAQ